MQHQFAYGFCEVKNGKLNSIKEKPKINFLANTGLYVIKKEILKFIPKNKKFDLTDMVNKCLKLKKKLEFTPYLIILGEILVLYLILIKHLKILIKYKMPILCTICARGGSKGIKNKALKLINKKPLIYYTINQAFKSKIFDEVVVSTDSKKIQKISKFYGAQSWFLRSKNLSNDNSPKLPVIRDVFLKSEVFFKRKFDICVDLDLTSPLRKISDIKQAIKKFKKEKSNNLFSVTHAKKNPYFNMVEKKNKTYVLSKKSSNTFVSRQKTPIVYEMNASIYVFKRKYLINNNKLFNSKTSIFLMPRDRSIDIDDHLDLKLVKKII